MGNSVRFLGANTRKKGGLLHSGGLGDTYSTKKTIQIQKSEVMNMGFLDNAPPCDRAVCFAYADGGCRVLTDTHFKCGCPFFKDAEAKKA